MLSGLVIRQELSRIYPYHMMVISVFKSSVTGGISMLISSRVLPL